MPRPKQMKPQLITPATLISSLMKTSFPPSSRSCMKQIVLVKDLRGAVTK